MIIRMPINRFLLLHFLPLFDYGVSSERMTKFTCSMIYGGLPPETRRSQAEHFNNGTNQVLVATDAVGMGLNLRIGRVIMSSLRKFDGGEQRLLTPSETKQIVGM